MNASVRVDIEVFDMKLYSCFWKTAKHSDHKTGLPILLEKCKPCKGAFEHFPLELDCFVEADECDKKIERLNNLDRDSTDGLQVTADSRRVWGDVYGKAKV